MVVWLVDIHVINIKLYDFHVIALVFSILCISSNFQTPQRTWKTTPQTINAASSRCLKLRWNTFFFHPFLFILHKDVSRELLDSIIFTLVAILTFKTTGTLTLITTDGVNAGSTIRTWLGCKALVHVWKTNQSGKLLFIHKNRVKWKAWN